MHINILNNNIFGSNINQNRVSIETESPIRYVPTRVSAYRITRFIIPSSTSINPVQNISNSRVLNNLNIQNEEIIELNNDIEKYNNNIKKKNYHILCCNYILYIVQVNLINQNFIGQLSNIRIYMNNNLSCNDTILQSLLLYYFKFNNTFRSLDIKKL